MRSCHKTIVCPGTSPETEFHTAGWIIVDAATVIENGSLEIKNGLIQGVHTAPPRGKRIDHGPGVLMPPLVNAHLHLELSALKGCLPFDQGFRAWVKLLLEKREALDNETLIKAARKAALALVRSGTLYAGDISTLGIVDSLVEPSGLGGVCFHEFLGSDLPSIFLRKGDRVSFSAAGHAPHTTSPQLLKALKKRTTSAGLPFSIHVAESEDESEFIRDRRGDWADFLTARNIDWSCWDIRSKTPVAHVADMGLLDRLTIVVHVLNASDADLQILARSNALVCVCPRSNLNLHGRLPDIEQMILHGICPALGTDSLASCDSLDVFDEMAFVRKHYPALDPETLFSMATVNGARALGIDHLTGTLSTGKRAAFLYRSVRIKNKKQLFKSIVSNES